MARDSSLSSRFAWALALAGLGLFTFALLALTGPGRLDIVDGQTRFEVGRSLVEHCDSVLRDDRVWWSSFPGRGGQNYSYYRFPQSVVAAGAILAADATGPVTEGRRHFFFVLGGAAASALLSIVYALWFRHIGCRPLVAILWGAGGIVCTPMWFYGTSTFDEYLCTTVLVAALVAAAFGRGRLVGAIVAGLLLGLAFNVKQPLVAFVLLAFALNDDPSQSRRGRILHAGIIVAGIVIGIATERAYDFYKFPFDKSAVHLNHVNLYGPDFANHQLTALAVLAVSPGGGAIWYFPPILLCLIGVAVRWRDDRRAVLALIISVLPILALIVSLSYFKGDQCWGPRYLTPIFGVMWLFAPFATTILRRSLVGLILAFGVGVQMLAISVDPHRLYVERDVSSGFGRVFPWLYFEPALSHLLNRPREIAEIYRKQLPAEEFTPSPSPTFAFPVIDRPYLPNSGPEAVRHYQILNSFRPWWASMSYLPPQERPVPLDRTAFGLLGMAIFGLILIGITVRKLDNSVSREPKASGGERSLSALLRRPSARG